MCERESVRIGVDNCKPILQMLMSDIENKKEFKAAVSAELSEAIDCRLKKIKVTMTVRL